jgi:integrase
MLTIDTNRNRLAPLQSRGGLLDMIHIRTLQKCCGKWINTGRDLVCNSCGKTPSRYYLHWYYHEPFKVYGFDSYREAHKRGVVIESEIQSGRFRAKDYKGGVVRIQAQYRFLERYDFWLEERLIKDLKSNNIAPSYFEKLQQYRRKFEFFGSSDIRLLNNDGIDNFHTELVRQGLGNKTIKNILNVLVKFLHDMKRKQVIDSVPDLPVISDSDHEGRWITKEVQLRGLEFVEFKYQPAIAFMFETGKRTQEVRAIRRSRINWKHDIPHIVIDASFSNNVFRETTKEKSISFVAITPEIERIIKSQPVRLDCEFLFYNLVSGKAVPFGEQCLCEAWRRACRKAGIEYVPLHEAGRHSFVTQKHLEGFTLEEIGQAINHSNIKTTKRYRHLDKIKASMKVMGTVRTLSVCKKDAENNKG